MGKLSVAGWTMAALAAAVAAASASCGQTPTNVPIRTFEGAQKVAVVCLQVNDPTTGLALPAVVPVEQNRCAPVAANVNASALPYHLFAAVTQTTRGELALVDLTTGNVVDDDRSTPGINFIPVGTNPTDVVESPDLAQAPGWTFVSSASPTKPGIFAVDNRRILGDAFDNAFAPLLLTDVPACSLPQQPVALAVAGGKVPGVDAGAPALAGTDTNWPNRQPPSTDFRIVALLAANGTAPATVVTIDPSFALASGNNAPPSGALPPCTILGRTALSSALPPTWTPGPAWPDGIAWVDGGVTGLSSEEPSVGPATACPAGLVDAGTMSMVGAGDGGPAVGDGGTAGATDDGGLADAGDDAAAEDAGLETAAAADAAIPLAVGPLTTPRPTAMVLRDDSAFLYVADYALPMIHVLDLRGPTPVEVAPLLATSAAQESRQVSVGALALSPVTSDHKRYLYAVDEPAGSIMVYDVTDPETSPHVPLLRPHPELNPLQPIDRLAFSAPVATLAFVRHDIPVQPINPPLPSDKTNLNANAFTGQLCNPNPAVYSQPGKYGDVGAIYRADLTSIVEPQGTIQGLPYRLRGVFGFVTLSDGTVVTIDVDDWDAPCRRYDPLTSDWMTGELAIPQPDAGSGPYQTPESYQPNNPNLGDTTGVTVEPFSPVSAPHRARSNYLLRNDPVSGSHIPTIGTALHLTDANGTQLQVGVVSGTARAVIMPTALGNLVDPTAFQNPIEPNPDNRDTIPVDISPSAGLPDGGADAAVVGPTAGAAGATTSQTPGIRMSFEDPTVHLNQDWAVTYEAILPGSQGVVADLSPGDASRQTLVFRTNGGDLCSLGIEDAKLGAERATQALGAMHQAGVLPDTYEVPEMDGGVTTLPNPELQLPARTADYVQIIDDLLGSSDPYWSQDVSCWQGVSRPIDATRAVPLDQPSPTLAADRYALCNDTFGSTGSTTDQNPNRDAPILEAYGDHLVTGVFVSAGGTVAGSAASSSSRTIGNPGNSSLPTLRQCCFHSQAQFRVRAGGEWVAVGSASGMMHHVQQGDGGRCVLSCNQNDVLLNARSFDVPWTKPNSCTPIQPTPAIDRNSPLAMRNPMLSYVMWSACGTFQNGAISLTPRDEAWRWSMTGGFAPLTIALSGTSGSPVSPQSMLFINSLGQLAVVDGSQQGLVLINLDTVSFQANYF